MQETLRKSIRFAVATTMSLGVAGALGETLPARAEQIMNAEMLKGPTALYASAYAEEMCAGRFTEEQWDQIISHVGTPADADGTSGNFLAFLENSRKQMVALEYEGTGCNGRDIVFLRDTFSRELEPVITR